ncbi:D-sedoheptulose-7-phosphate isomerase [Halomonas beimenensis]|uniref:Phosphoheptose isomerase n=1 Tax=Halomonas beimenensis TaxID=475662 RepID=A0A291P5V8_9GAMM|nr:SIS domain-containing protein [Halomonas beimenensis]ATJ82265.1 phosphoheptose isomerase [Halomonas beimenensis]
MADDVDPLRDLYPFLHGELQDDAGVQDALLASVREKADHGVQVKREFFASRGQAVVDAARAIAGVYRRGGRMLTMGNGGSSCDAAHFAVEFLHPVTAGRAALAAIPLAGNDAMLTAVGNDVGFDHVFVRQLLALARPEDGLVGFSTSGNSRNLMRAFAQARKLGLMTLGLAGGDGGEMARSDDLDHCLVVATDSIHRVQEVHVATYHILWDLVHTLLADRRGGLEAGP